MSRMAQSIGDDFGRPRLRLVAPPEERGAEATPPSEPSEPGEPIETVSEGVGEAGLVGVKQIARILGRTSQWVYDQVALGQIPHRKVGRYLMFDPARVLENYPEIGGRL